MSDRPYQPIDCSFYDRLEEASTLRRICRLGVNGLHGEEVIEDCITDLRIVDQAEYMFLAGGRRIRLDDLLSLDDHLVPGQCTL